jgi:hypothetical protein
MPMANPAPETCECARGFAAFDCSALRKAFAGAYMADYGHTRARAIEALAAGCAMRLDTV